MRLQGQQIFVGLSGGVDSAVSAALLARGGADVTGVFIKGWYPPGMPCTWAQVRIPFLTLDASAEYKKSVIDYLLSEYRAGRTPNPDAMCNRDVKFGAFYRFARGRGANYIATGHYRSGEKDQSYFLWAVPQEALAHALFPVGNMEKPRVRALARRFGLSVAEKKDSQGVCFLGAVSLEEFLEGEFGRAPGAAKDDSGRLVGTHAGAALATIGERVGLSGAREPGPWYVLAKDRERNELTVGKERGRAAAAPREIAFSDANWHRAPEEAAYAQYRYRAPFSAGRVEGHRFVPAGPLTEPVAPGQSLVFYDAARALVGGGIISE